MRAFEYHGLMRTTLTLDNDLVRELKRLAHQSDQSFKDVVDETLRRGLASRGHKTPTNPFPPFRVEAKARGFRDGVDIEHLNRLNDELETADFQRELAVDTKHRSADE